MIICSPHVGVAPESSSGGEVYERELLKHLALLGVAIEPVLSSPAPSGGTSPTGKLPARAYHPALAGRCRMRLCTLFQTDTLARTPRQIEWATGEQPWKRSGAS